MIESKYRFKADGTVHEFNPTDPYLVVWDLATVGIRDGAIVSAFLGQDDGRIKQVPVPGRQRDAVRRCLEAARRKGVCA